MVPDVGSLNLPGAKAEVGGRHKRGDMNIEGVRGLKALGVRDLNYRTAFLACSVVPTNPKVKRLAITDTRVLGKTKRVHTKRADLHALMSTLISYKFNPAKLILPVDKGLSDRKSEANETKKIKNVNS